MSDSVSPAAAPRPAAEEPVAAESRRGQIPIAELLPDEPDRSPDFIREAWREAVSFVETTASAVWRPGRFAQSWVRGESEAMNPLAYFGLCLSLGAGMEVLQRHLTGLPDPAARSWWTELAGTNVALGVVALYGLYLHWDLRRHGFILSRRAAVGLTLLSAGAVSFATDLADQLFRVVYWLFTKRVPHLPTAAIGCAVLLIQTVWLTRVVYGATQASAGNRSIWHLADKLWGLRTLVRWVGGVGVALTCVILLSVGFVMTRGRVISHSAQDAARRALTRPGAREAWDKQAAQATDIADTRDDQNLPPGLRMGRFFRRLFRGGEALPPPPPAPAPAAPAQAPSP